MKISDEVLFKGPEVADKIDDNRQLDRLQVNEYSHTKIIILKFKKKEAVREVEFEDAAIEKLLEEHARAHEEAVNDDILPIHPVGKLHNDEIAPVEVNGIFN